RRGTPKAELERRHRSVRDESELLAYRGHVGNLLTREQFDKGGVGQGQDHVVHTRRLDVVAYLLRTFLRGPGDRQLLGVLGTEPLDRARDVTSAERLHHGG